MHKIVIGKMYQPEFYYEWGTEPAGFVTTGLYVDDVWKGTGLMKKEEAITKGLKYNCPHS